MRRLLAGLLLLAALTACSPTGPTPNEPPRASTQPIHHTQMPKGWHGDDSYQPVDTKWLEARHRSWRAELFRKGVTKWDERFDCNRFVASFKADINVGYFIATFHTADVGQSAAVGEVWYTRDLGGRHAVLQVLTEQGWRYFDPQTGHWTSLSAAEERSVDKRDF